MLDLGPKIYIFFYTNDFLFFVVTEHVECQLGSEISSHITFLPYTN
jgi:hypothetical protein